MLVDGLDQPHPCLAEFLRLVGATQVLRHVTGRTEGGGAFRVDLGHRATDPVVRDNIAPANNPVRLLAGGRAPHQSAVVLLAHDITGGPDDRRIELIQTLPMAAAAPVMVGGQDEQGRVVVDVESIIVGLAGHRVVELHDLARLLLAPGEGAQEVAGEGLTQVIAPVGKPEGVAADHCVGPGRIIGEGRTSRVVGHHPEHVDLGPDCPSVDDGVGRQHLRRLHRLLIEGDCLFQRPPNVQRGGKLVERRLFAVCREGCHEGELPPLTRPELQINLERTQHVAPHHVRVVRQRAHVGDGADLTGIGGGFVGGHRDGRAEHPHPVRVAHIIGHQHLARCVVVCLEVRGGVATHLGKPIHAHRAGLARPVGQLHPLIGHRRIPFLPCGSLLGRRTSLGRPLGHEERLLHVEVARQHEAMALVRGMDHDLARLLRAELDIGAAPRSGLVLSADDQPSAQTAKTHQHGAHDDAPQVGAEEAVDAAAPLGRNPAVPIPQTGAQRESIAGQAIDGQSSPVPSAVRHGRLRKVIVADRCCHATIPPGNACPP